MKSDLKPIRERQVDEALKIGELFTYIAFHNVFSFIEIPMLPPLNTQSYKTFANEF